MSDESTDQPDESPTPPVAPEWYARPELAPVLLTHDVGALYRALTETGLSQHRIARLTSQAQSEVCEILKGRRVVAYGVLARLTSGLGIPPERMGLMPGGVPTAPGTALATPTLKESESPIPRRG